MKAVILVGGEGTRLRPLTLHCLKSMAPIAGRPFLEYQLGLLRRNGVRDVALSICHMPERLRRAYGDGRRFGVRLHYALEREPLGTAGAIKNAERFVAGPEPVAVLNGDVLTGIDLARMAAEHRRRRAVATLALTPVEDPSHYGLVRQDRQQRILSFIEKPSLADCASPWINAGVYLFSPEVFARIPAGQNYSAERALFPGLLASGARVWGFRTREYWMDIGTLERYWQANQDVLAGRLDRLPAGKATRRRGVFAGTDCRLDAGARFGAPVVLGDGCAVAAGAELGDRTVCGRGVKIGAGAKVAASVLWNDVVVGESAVLEGCVLADGVRIGRHARVRPGTVLGQGAVVPDFSRV